MMKTSPIPALTIVGLGRMGANMLRRLSRAGLMVSGYDSDATARVALAGEPGIAIAESLQQAISRLAAPRVVWLMLPAGDVTEQAITAVAAQLSPGDIVVDGGNADYRDSVRRAAELLRRDLRFVDVGVAGGLWGLENGYGLMFGGSDDAVAALATILKALAPAADRGWVHCGPAGSGHYTKMIHNGVEYGLMQAYAEGFALLRAKQEFGLNVGAIAEAWRHGTVVRSWLLDLTAAALRDDSTLTGIAPVVADSGEGRWAVRESLDLRVPAPVITAALSARFTSQGHGDFSARILARVRNAFGGHAMSHTNHDRKE